MKIYFVMASLVFCTFSANAKDINILSAAQTKSAVISGVLAPASLSFNGQEIEQSSASYEGLLLNDQEVPTTEVGGLKTFYVTVDKSSIDLKWKKSNSETKDILKIEYPAITEMHLIKNNIFLKFNLVTAQARIDTQDTKIVESATSYPIENLKQWLEDVHTIELGSNQKSSQIYNLDFKELKTDLLTNMTWTLYRGQAPFFANGSVDSTGVGYRIQRENSRSWELILSYSKSNYTQCCFFTNGIPADNTVDQSALEIKTRYGTNPFFTNYGDFNYKRLTVGLQGEVYNYKRISSFQTNMDGYNSDHVDQWFYGGGPFFRWEPLQYDHFGLSINFDFNWLRSNSMMNRDSDVKYLGLSYTY